MSDRPEADAMTNGDAEDRRWMQRALALAAQAGELGEVPVGAVVVRDGELLGEGYNQVISAADPTAHAEIVALRQAAQRAGNYRLPGTRLYVTLEPCTMCAGAMVHARLAELVFGATEPRAGVICSRGAQLDAPWYNHRVQWRGGVLAEASGSLLRWRPLPEEHQTPAAGRYRRTGSHLDGPGGLQHRHGPPGRCAGTDRSPGRRPPSLE